jgi:hypothetical protein
MNPSVPAVTHRVRLHFKVLEWPSIKLDDMVADMRTVYAAHGIAVDPVPTVEDLLKRDPNLEVINDLWVCDCALGSTTREQEQLFAYRNGVPDDEICIYFVRSVPDSGAGCASRAKPAASTKERPAAAVARSATRWTLGHECGHVLGLRHVTPVTQLMVGSTSKIKAPPLPALDKTEAATIKQSLFIKPPGPGNARLAGPPPSAPPRAMEGGDAIRSTGEDGDRLADAIRDELDQDDGVDYDELARRFGPSAVEALATVVCESGPRTAPGAVALAARLEAGTGFPVVAQGAANEDPVVRVAAAASARRLPEKTATPVVERLLEDRDVGVRGHAVRSAVRIGTPDLLERVRVKEREDPSPAIRELARGVLHPPTGSAS